MPWRSHRLERSWQEPRQISHPDISRVWKCRNPTICNFWSDLDTPIQSQRELDCLALLLLTEEPCTNTLIRRPEHEPGQPDLKKTLRVFFNPEMMWRCAWRKRGGRDEISDVYSRCKCFSPELFRNISGEKHCSSSIKKGAIHSFCDSILLRTVRNGALMQ